MRARARRWLAIVAAALVLLVFLVWGILSQREPVYRGKTLSDWAQQYGAKWTVNRAAADEAELAIRQIGTNSIPFMIDLMRASDTPLKKRLRRIVPPQWHAPLHLNDDMAKIRRLGAYAISALGTNAPTAVPLLIDLAKTHPDPDGRYIPVFALRNIGPAAESAVPFYIQCLTNADGAIRNEAAQGLTFIPQQWQRNLPHLMKYVESIKSASNTSRGWELPHAVQLLGQMSTNAQPAVPILLTLLNDPDSYVREALTNSLPSIDSDAATKAGVKRP
jgi:hypothetical protein